MSATPRDMSQFWLAKMDTLGVFTRRGFARYDDIKSRYFAADPASRYPVLSNVIYAERLGGLILQPDLTLHNLSYTGLTIGAGGTYTRDCTPPELGVTCPMYYNAAPNDSPGSFVWSIQGGLLPASPCFTAYLLRTEAPPVGQSPYTQRWRLLFGGLTLSWGRFENPVLTDGAGTEIARYTVNESDRQQYAWDTVQRWDIASLGGELHLSCSGFSDNWTVVYPTLPAARWTVQANGGVCAAHVEPLTFASSGYLVTPWIEEGYAYPDGDLIGTVFPASSGSVSTTVTVEAVSGTQKQYRLTLASTDIRQTPIARGFQTFYESAYAALSTTKTEITNWFVHGRESLTQDYSARNTQLQFREDTDFVTAVGRLSGHRVITYATGYDTGNGVPVRQTRMTGIMGRISRTGNLLTMEVYDQYTKLSRVKLFNMPCLWGLGRGLAIALIARCAGVHPDNIYINPNITGVIGDPALPFSVDGPRWTIEDGTSATDAINKICKTYGVRAIFDGDGVLTIYQFDDTTTTNSYSSDAGTDPLYALGTAPFEGVEFQSDLTGAVNHLVIIGQDGGGMPIMTPRYDPTSVSDDTSERYIGYYASDVQRNADLGTPGEVAEATAKGLQDIDYGLPKVPLQGNHALALCHQLPREFIEVTDNDTALDHRDCKILQMDVEIDAIAPPVTSMGLEVWP